MVEECILSVYNQTKIVCPVHMEIQMSWLAPDVVFADIPERYNINSEDIVKGALLGRGAFGFVFKATCKVKATRSFQAVAMKMLQPVPPGPRAKEVLFFSTGVHRNLNLSVLNFLFFSECIASLQSCFGQMGS